MEVRVFFMLCLLDLHHPPSRRLNGLQQLVWTLQRKEKSLVPVIHHAA
jgi:hypothetical protein